MTLDAIDEELLPAVAIARGALVRDERIALASVGGCVLVLAGAYVTSGAGRRPSTPPAR